MLFSLTKNLFCLLSADDDSDTSPHDLEGGGSDHDYTSINITGGLGLSSHLNIGQHSFSEMQVCAFFFFVRFSDAAFFGENLFG